MTATTYSSLISIENLFQAWKEFAKGKRKKRDVMVFERNLKDNLFNLHSKLVTKTYRHGNYFEFYVNDPKRRHIHKANAADRILHHLLYKYLYGLFDKTFIYDSYSCRLGKGTHKAVKRLEKFTKIVSKNYTQDCWALKLDVKKFFASVDHKILSDLVSKRVKDKDIIWLINLVIDSFHRRSGPQVGKESEENRFFAHTQNDMSSEKGIPLGNLTSQIFANIYLNQLDQFAKHNLKVKYYIRYADDFIIIDKNLDSLFYCFKTVKQFVKDNLSLNIHPGKIILRKLTWGIDFCGYIILPHYILPRTKTAKRIIKKSQREQIHGQSLQSYLGYFSHAQAYKLSQNLRNLSWLIGP